MVHALIRHFSEIYSIELSPDLYAKAIARFGNSPHVHILEGDSAGVLPTLLLRLPQPCLFWLDGHYSGGETARGSIDTPVQAELRVVLARPTPDVILVDDARLFLGRDDYPTVKAVKEQVQNARPEYAVNVREDIIRIYPVGMNHRPK